MLYKNFKIDQIWRLTTKLSIYPLYRKNKCTSVLMNMFSGLDFWSISYITEARITFGFIVNGVYNNKIIIIFIEGYTVS